MTIQELIIKLSAYKPDTEVLINDDGNFCAIDKITADPELPESEAPVLVNIKTPVATEQAEDERDLVSRCRENLRKLPKVCTKGELVKELSELSDDATVLINTHVDDPYAYSWHEIFVDKTVFSDLGKDQLVILEPGDCVGS